MEVEVSNDGAPLDPDFEKRRERSLGLQIVEALAREDLGGKFEMTSQGMTRARIVFPRESEASACHDLEAIAS